MRLACTALKNGLDFRVNRDVRLLKAVDGVRRPGHLRKMKEAADVVILVECAEELLGLLTSQPEFRKRRGESKPPAMARYFSTIWRSVMAFKSTGTRRNPHTAR